MEIIVMKKAIKNCKCYLIMKHFYLCVIVTCFFLHPFELFSLEAPEQDLQTAVNTHKDGGLLQKWLIVAPLTRYSESDTLQNDSISGFDYDFLEKMGGESKATIRKNTRIRIDSASVCRYIRPVEVEADSNGIINIDTFFTKNEDEAAYAFCLVEAFIPCSVRCLWGVDGDARVWVNGKRMHNKWDGVDTCLPLSRYFDTEFIQGMNSVLIKLSDKKGKSRFTFEVWDLRDSLKPFENNIRSLFLDLNRNEIINGSDSLSAKLRFNIPTPENMFKGKILIYREPDKALLKKVVSSYTIGVEVPFKMGVPNGLQGAVCIDVSINYSKNKKVETQRYIWKGNFEASIDSQYARFERFNQDIKQGATDNVFINTFIQGACKWVKDWFTVRDSLEIDSKVRQLGYVQANGDLIESLVKGKRLKGDIAYPLYLSLGVIKQEEKPSEGYDPSTWLNYRYPDTYTLPKDVKGATEYRFWLYLPSDAGKKRKKMPLILALHDINNCGYDINKIKGFGPGAYAGTVKKFPFAVVTPQCRYNTLWDAKALKKLLDTLIATGRFNKNRIYVTGVGMGAFTTWYLPQKYPKYFAAALPINGGGDEENICRIRKASIWAFHGAKDDIIPVEQSKNLVKALKDCGRKNVEFSIYSEHGHNLYSIIYNDPRIYKWLKKQ